MANAPPKITSNAKQKPGHQRGTPRVFNQQVMDEVKNSVPDNGRDNQPTVSSEAEYGK
jgi:hypothetical protein